MELFAEAWSTSPKGSFETCEMIYARGKQVRKFLKEFILNNVSEDAKVAVVCHSKLISALTASSVEGSGPDSQLKDFTWFSNCEIGAFKP